MALVRQLHDVQPATTIRLRLLASTWLERRGVEDLSDLESNNGVQRAKRYISPAGKRQDTGHCYLHPRLQDGKHPNLHVVVDSQVIRVLFDDRLERHGCQLQAAAEPIRPGFPWCGLPRGVESGVRIGQDQASDHDVLRRRV